MISPLPGIALLVLVLLVPNGSAAAEDGRAPTAVHPTPQSVHDRPEVVRIPESVTVVTGERTDPAALAVVHETLEAAGVRTSERGRLTVYVGGRAENAATEEALRALGVKGAEGIAAEGYVLAVGNGRDGRARIVLDGVDPSGTFYAAQTLRQLMAKSKSLRGTETRDWPSLRTRGVVEGFYGPPWSHEVRLADLAYYGRHKLNTYVYTPKDDPYLRAEWRRPYPAAEFARLSELVTRAKTGHVEFVYVLSPGLSVCYSTESDVLIAKFETLRSIGVRTFVVAFDDIDYQRWNCAEDRAAFGTGPAPPRRPRHI